MKRKKVIKSKSKNSSKQPLDKNNGEETNHVKIGRVKSPDLNQESRYNRRNVFYESLRDVALFF